MHRVCCLLVVVGALSGIQGCTQEPRGGPRLETYPVTGRILYEGKPADAVIVECHPEAGGQLGYAASVFTDAEGKFSIGTYEADDGLPEGTYSLAFTWPEPGIVEKDRLKKAFADPKKSKFKVTVVKGQPNDLGDIDLSKTD